MDVRLVVTASMLALLACAGCSATKPVDNGTQNLPASAAKSNEDILVRTALRKYINGNDVNGSLKSIQSAAEKSGNRRADILWLQAQICAEVATCDPRAVEQQLQQLDPDNGAAWLASLARAQESNDKASVNRLLDKIGTSATFKVYWNSLLANTVLTSSRFPDKAKTQNAKNKNSIRLDLPLTTALNEITELFSPLVALSLEPFSAACAPLELNDPATAERCRRVADKLIRGDTYISEGVGFGIAEKLAKEGSAQSMNLIDQIQVSRYQRELAGQIVSGPIDHEKIFREMLEMMTKLPREQDVFIAVIRWSGEPVVPSFN